MDCKVTCFDRVMNLVEELPKNKHREAVRIIQECSFNEFLDFCVDNDCFTKEQSLTLYDGIVMWEDLYGNYWEEDYDKLHELYDRVGITEEVLSKHTNKTNETIKEDIEYVLRQMCFGWNREWTDEMVDKIFKTNAVYYSCVDDDMSVDENIIISALMEIVSKD